MGWHCVYQVARKITSVQVEGNRITSKSENTFFDIFGMAPKTILVKTMFSCQKG